ncbi:hypothetical protein [Agaribacter flavus]|uniref:Uncharacterized protein n=1 Tax=Agaribacter flavus TaxID=1902781 RepID=A0ABV7FR42_9ALTE
MKIDRNQNIHDGALPLSRQAPLHQDMMQQLNMVSWRLSLGFHFMLACSLMQMNKMS